MRRIVLAAATTVFGLGVAGCSSGASKPAAEPTSQAAVDTTSSQPAATCNLKSQGDVIERVVVPGQPATAQELGGVNLQDCTLTFDDLAAETSTDPGYCTTAAWAADNVGYDVNAVPAPPLKKVQAKAGAACGQG